MPLQAWCLAGVRTCMTARDRALAELVAMHSDMNASSSPPSGSSKALSASLHPPMVRNQMARMGISPTRTKPRQTSPMASAH